MEATEATKQLPRLASCSTLATWLVSLGDLTELGKPQLFETPHVRLLRQALVYAQRFGIKSGIRKYGGEASVVLRALKGCLGFCIFGKRSIRREQVALSNGT